MAAVSLFKDVIGPVMRGPSSSLPTTQENQGGDMGLAVTPTSLEIKKRHAGRRQGCGTCCS